MNLSELRIGYLPYDQNFEKPGDRRRFVHYATKRKLNFEVAKPSEKYDLLVLSQNADLSIWPNYNLGGKTKIVYEAINSYLAVPKNELKGRLRSFAKFVSRKSKYLRFSEWKAIEDMCSRADAVVCSTLEQETDIKPFCDNIHLILDVQSEVSTRVKNNYKSDKVFNIVWEGMADNIYQFELLKNVFTDLEKRHEIALHFVTDLTYFKYLGKYGKKYTKDVVKDLCKNTYLYDWNKLTCSEIICSADLAIIPVDLTNPLVLGKPENKLLLFWRMGMPTITSATPAYNRSMDRAGLAMTCTNEKQWIDTIEKYLIHENLRREAGLAGKKLVDTEYNEEVTLKKWDLLFRSLYN